MQRVFLRQQALLQPHVQLFLASPSVLQLYRPCRAMPHPEPGKEGAGGGIVCSKAACSAGLCQPGRAQQGGPLPLRTNRKVGVLGMLKRSVKSHLVLSFWLP